MRRHPPEVTIINLADQLSQKVSRDLQEIRYWPDKEARLDRASTLRLLFFTYTATFVACAPKVRKHDEVLNAGLALLVRYVQSEPNTFLDVPLGPQEMANACASIFKTYLDGWNNAAGFLRVSNPEGALAWVKWMIQHLLSISLPAESNDPETHYRIITLTGTAANVLRALAPMREAF